MAIAFGSSPAATSTNNASLTTSSFTPAAGALLVVCTASGGTGRTVTVSSNTGLTFTKRAEKNNLGLYSIDIYTAVVGSSTSTTVTTLWNTGASNFTKVWVVTGADPSNPIGATFNGPATSVTSTTWSPSVYTSTVDGSMMIFGGAPGSVANGVTFSSTDTIDYDSTSMPAGSTHKASVTATAGTSVSGNITCSSAPSSSWVGVAIEVVPSQTVSPSGIATAEAFGTAVVTRVISPSGIASGEAFGTPALSLSIALTGIPSAEAFGSTNVFSLVSPTGIPSGEAVGTPSLIYNQTVSPSGITSAETFGSISLQLGYPQSMTMIGIVSSETFGFATVRNRSVWVLSPNHIQETPAGRDILTIRYGIDRGISLVKSGGVWSEVRYPAQTDLEAAQKYYLGGYRYLLTPEEASDLTSQGFGSLLHLEPLPEYSGV